MEKIEKTDHEWKALLTPGQYEVLRRHGTEHPFTGEFVKTHDYGIYRCAGCGNELFSSEDKYESHSGWPSFTDVVDAGHITLVKDGSWGMERTEVRCAACGGHLGHLFPDGPPPTGLRYCMNSAALTLDRR